MNYTLATVHQTISCIMAAKPLDIIVGQPTTETMDNMTKQMAQMFAPDKTTAWGGLPRSLAHVLDNVDYVSITELRITSTTPVTQPAAINAGITDTSTPLKILTFLEDTKKLQKEFDLQEAVINIGVQCIINCVEEQYIKKLNEEYFGYASCSIKIILNHPHSNWCKVMIQEHTNASKASFQVWVPSITHVITFSWQLKK
jgi:hypothetical protein